MKKVYLAAPFFKPQEIEVLEVVESLMFSSKEIDPYSPRKLIALPPRASVSDRKKAFNLNVEFMDKCDLVLAGVDFPDTGTSWEMGYAYAIKKPVVIYTLLGKKINVMLAQSCSGVLEGNKSVEEFIKGKMVQEEGWAPSTFDFNWEVAQEWKKEIY